MKNTSIKFSILALAIVLLMSLTAFFGINFITADASGSITVSGTNVFTAGGDANVIVDKQGDGESAVYYTMFSFADDEDNVSYRRNLAYYWMNGADDIGLFNMNIGFKSVTFEKFVITFESQQYNKTKDGKSINYVIFFPEGNGVKVLITTDKDAGEQDVGNTTVLDPDHIAIRFTAKLSGSYAVSVGNVGGTTVSGSFENVGGNYSKSSTSSTSPVYPLIFNAQFAEEGEREAATMVLYSLNGQAFEVTNASLDSDKGYYYGGTVKDTMHPVLCLTEELTYFTLGEALEFDCVVIDVLRSSPSKTTYYYVLTYDQYIDSEIEDYNDTDLFEEAESDLLLESDVDKYLPDAQTAGSTVYGDKFKADMVVKVYLDITDTTSSDGEHFDVYLDWYVSDNYLININDANFIAVAEDNLGVTYNYGDNWQAVKDAYQAELDKLAKNLSAGSSSNLYLPSAENLFVDNATAYTDMKLSIYYYNNSKQNNSNLATSNLSISINQQGAYTFTIYATDAAGNNMYYMDGDEVVEFEASEIWDMFDDKGADGLYNKLPWFTFNVGYTGVEFEETPGMQSTAYVGTNYSSASFKINGISGSYSTTYKLFVFERARFFNDYKNNPEYFNGSVTYQQFIEVMDEWFNDPEIRTYFTEIPEVSEGDADYEKFKDYEWSSSSTSFTPQDANAYYMIRAEVTDNQYVTDPVTCSLAVVASINAKSLKGESDWLKNNVASVVLLSIAGVALIGIILLLVIKPKDNGDIDVQFENEKKKTKKSK